MKAARTNLLRSVDLLTAVHSSVDVGQIVVYVYCIIVICFLLHFLLIRVNFLSIYCHRLKNENDYNVRRRFLLCASVTFALTVNIFCCSLVLIYYFDDLTYRVIIVVTNVLQMEFFLGKEKKTS